MEQARQALFDDHPDPMWVYDLETLAFLDVNRAAIEQYGYSRDEFLARTIRDIRPEEDVAAVETVVDRIAKNDRPQPRSGFWRHRRKDGGLVHVDIRGRTIRYGGRPARLISARDVTRLVALEEERASLLERERRSRTEAETAAAHFRALFEALPGSFLVLSPGDHRIVAASDAYLEATMTTREAIEGRPLFEVFPADPDDPEADGAPNLRASLERIEATGMRDVMAVQRYPIPRPGSAGGGFEVRYWSPVNTPVKDAHGNVACIIHRVEDVTDLVRENDGTAAPLHPEVGQGRLELDILLRSRELKSVNERLKEQEANLRTAQRLLGLGLWKLDLATNRLTWSDNVYDMYGVAREAFGHDFDAYVALVHPEDREGMRAGYAAFEASGETEFTFEHRILRPDGRIVHVRGIGELTESDGGLALGGVVQNVTDEKEQAARLADAMRLLRIAGRVARLGGWRVDLPGMRARWSEEMAEIHELPDAQEIDVEQAIAFYPEEAAERIRSHFTACVEEGQPFDDVLPFVTALGRRLWVRAIGEAERDEAGNIRAVHGALQDITELVDTRERSEELARRLRDTLENISDAFFTLDHDWRFTFTNTEFERVVGRRHEELVGRNVWEAFPDAAELGFKSKYEQAMATGEPAYFDEYYPALARWLRIKAYPTPEGLAVYFQDVTRERVREEQLRLLEAAVARQNDILLITEAAPIDAPHGPCIVYVNEAFTRRTGYAADEAVGQTPRFLQGPETDRRELDRIRLALTNAEPVRAELVNYTRTGEAMWLELDIAPIIDDAARLTHFVAVERDITDRKRADEARRLAEERFRLVAKATNDVIWDWDLVSGRVWWNENITTLFGHDRQNLPPGPESWVTHIHPGDRERVVAGIHAVIDGTDVHWSDEYRFLRANGGVTVVVDRGFVIRDEAGQAVRMLGSMIDVTERRELDERLRQSQKLEAVGQLTGGVAHDFNNLLTVILGNAETLSEHFSEDDQLRLIAEMTTTAAERGAELTRRLLAFARRQTLEPKPIDVNQLIAGMDGLLRRTLTEDIDIEIVRGGGLWIAEVDPGQLEVAILNLAINARDAMPEGGRLTIETANTWLDEAYARDNVDVLPGQYVLVSVADTGHGMPPEAVERAFEPFFTTKEVGKGSGLGLSMVYGFVKQSGGHAKIYSEPGHGTAAKLYLPRAASDRAPFTPEPVAEESQPGNEHVLVVEDDPLVREHLSAQLVALGYRVTAAGSGPEAMAIIDRDDGIDLLFTDVVMPGGMDGRQLAEAAQRRRPGLKVLYTSGYTENAIVHHGRLDPGVHLLSKPYRRQELARKLRRVLDE